MFPCKSDVDCNNYQRCSSRKICESHDGLTCYKDADCGGSTYFCHNNKCKSKIKVDAACIRSSECGMYDILCVIGPSATAHQLHVASYSPLPFMGNSVVL